MHDAAAVGVVEGAQDAVGHLQGAVRRHPVLVAQHVAERAPLDVLHDDVRHRVVIHRVLAGVVHGDHGRMVQRRGGLRLTAEPCLERGVAGKVRPKCLDRHYSIETEITSSVDLGHTATPDDSIEFVAATE